MLKRLPSPKSTMAPDTTRRTVPEPSADPAGYPVLGERSLDRGDRGVADAWRSVSGCARQELDVALRAELGVPVGELASLRMVKDGGDAPRVGVPVANRRDDVLHAPGS